MKKNYTFKGFLTLLCFCMNFIMSSAQTFEKDGINYAVIEGTSSVKVVNSPNASGSITIPSIVEYEGVNYPITTIGQYAFANSGLTSITIPSSVTNLEAWAFYHCEVLTSATLNDGLTTIGESAFRDSGLTSITIPSSVTNIGNFAFLHTNNLTSFTSLATTPPTLGDIVFEGEWQSNCDLFVPNTTAVTAYQEAEQWEKFRSINNFSKFDLDGIAYEAIDTNKVKVIEHFNGNYYTGEIIIPASINYQGVNYNVTEIADYAFIFSNVESVTLPEGITTIGIEAFHGSGLKSINLPSTLSHIGAYAFSYSKITTINLPSSIINLERGVFYECNLLTSTTIEEGLSTIRESALARTGLSSIILPSTVTNIETEAFANNFSLTRFTSLATTLPKTASNAFAGAGDEFWQSHCDLYVPASSLDEYRTAEPWRDFRRKYPTNSLSTNDVKLEKPSIYPNPAKDFVIVSNIKKGANIGIYDVAGKLVFATKSNDTSITINTASLNNGLYLINVDGQTSKLMITK